MDCCCSVTKLCLILCNCMDCLLHARFPCPSLSPGVCSNSFHWVSNAIQPSHSVTPFSSCLQSSCIRLFSNESVLCIRWPKYWSFSLSVSPSNEDSELISLRIDWFDLLAVQGIFKSLIQSLCVIDLFISYSFVWSLYFFLTVFFCFLFKIVMTLIFCRVQESFPVHEGLESLTVLEPESMGNCVPGLWKPQQDLHAGSEWASRPAALSAFNTKVPTWRCHRPKNSLRSPINIFIHSYDHGGGDGHIRSTDWISRQFGKWMLSWSIVI